MGRAGGKVDVRARRKARRALVQAVYQWQMNAADATALGQEFAGGSALKDADHAFFEDVLALVIDQSDNIDHLYENQLDRAKDRLDGVELAILRLGTCELRSRPDIPGPVVINEYIELAKLFGAQDSHKYINGVLDNLAKRLRHGAVPANG